MEGRLLIALELLSAQGAPARASDLTDRVFLANAGLALSGHNRHRDTACNVQVDLDALVLRIRWSVDDRFDERIPFRDLERGQFWRSELVYRMGGPHSHSCVLMNSCDRRRVVLRHDREGHRIESVWFFWGNEAQDSCEIAADPPL
jgi:hypothetical protein